MPNVPSPIFSLFLDLLHTPGAQDALAALEQGRSVAVDGVVGSACAAVLCSLMAPMCLESSALDKRKTPKKGTGVGLSTALSARKRQFKTDVVDEPRDSCPTWLVVLPDETQADNFATDLETFGKIGGPDFVQMRFPPFDLFTHRSAVADDAFGERLRVLKRLDNPQSDPRQTVIITTLSALILKTPRKRFLEKQTLSIRVHDEIGVENLVDFLVGKGETGFHRTPAVQMPGEFSVRGGIVDVYPLDFDDPVRIEFFGDEIDSLRTFEVGNQKSLKKLDVVDLTVSGPAIALEKSDKKQKSVNPKDSIIKDSIIIGSGFGSRVGAGSTADAASQTETDSEVATAKTGQVEQSSQVGRTVQTGQAGGIGQNKETENQTSGSSRETASGTGDWLKGDWVRDADQDDSPLDFLTDHLPANCRILYIDPVEAENQSRRFLNNQDSLLRHQREMEKVGGFSGKNDLLATAIQMDDVPAYLGTVSGVAGRLYRFPLLSMAAFASQPLDAYWHIDMESVEMFTGDFNRILQQFDDLSVDQSIHLLCATETEVQRLQELLSKTKTCEQGRLHFHVGIISGGFRLHLTSPTDGLRPTILSADEIFKRTTIKRTASRRHLGKVIDSFSELKEGDYVVHLGQGIGRYLGVVLLDRPDGQSEENLKLEFADDTTLYVPVSRISLVQKYIGTGANAPPLARIGGKRWQAQKEKVAQEIADMAGEMLHLQAMRKTQPGVAFPVNTSLQKEFDACFPYNETPDQLETMKAIDFDLSQTRPMDRLLCGDVGFGKTEMAIRAAFRAVEAGYQVAVLVPTTVLCEQHWQTFQERMAEFPVRIAALSRFTPPAEQAKIVEQLHAGTIDIVIGTHRLVSKDIGFYNLGLIIIDEEQKFGVDVKERLKQFRASVDVLTMTATPIPRTLHFALLGIRDISNLLTPPEDRMPVETHVVRFSDELVRSAIEREIARKGQVFFVHNKVCDIVVVAEKLKQLVPEARIGIGHAQMAENELEVVMRDFVQKKYDVLVCTTIVESGLDIPNANTIFIDQADRFGLANLHQLRGRVGRYKNRAYCYLLIENTKSINPTAVKRLQAIEEFSQLGAGFTLAMRDLEIRGAGNILGKQQSGHIALIGYELYCQLLEDAVRKQTRQPPRETNDVTVLLPITAYIPDFYIPDMRQKMDLYRRVSRVVKMQDVEMIQEELRDRFNDPPSEVVNLMELATLRVLAHEKFINKIYSDGEYYIFEFASRRIMEQIQSRTKRPIRIADDNTAWMKVETRDSDPVYLTAMFKALLKS